MHEKKNGKCIRDPQYKGVLSCDSPAVAPLRPHHESVVSARREKRGRGGPYSGLLFPSSPNPFKKLLLTAFCQVNGPFAERPSWTAEAEVVLSPGVMLAEWKEVVLDPLASDTHSPTNDGTQKYLRKDAGNAESLMGYVGSKSLELESVGVEGGKKSSELVDDKRVYGHAWSAGAPEPLVWGVDVEDKGRTISEASLHISGWGPCHVVLTAEGLTWKSAVIGRDSWGDNGQDLVAAISESCCLEWSKRPEEAQSLPIEAIYGIDLADFGTVPGRPRAARFGRSLVDTHNTPPQMHRFVVYTYAKVGNESGRWKPCEITMGHGNLGVCMDWAAAIKRQLGTIKDRPKRLMVVVNPWGGKRLGMQTWEKVRPIFERAGVETTVKKTERFRHAQELMEDLNDDDVAVLDGMVVVGGDGLFNEVLNGLLHARHKAPVPDKCPPVLRPDPMAAQIPSTQKLQGAFSGNSKPSSASMVHASATTTSPNLPGSSPGPTLSTPTQTPILLPTPSNPDTSPFKPQPLEICDPPSPKSPPVSPKRGHPLALTEPNTLHSLHRDSNPPTPRSQVLHTIRNAPVSPVSSPSAPKPAQIADSAAPATFSITSLFSSPYAYAPFDAEPPEAHEAPAEAPEPPAEAHEHLPQSGLTAVSTAEVRGEAPGAPHPATSSHQNAKSSIRGGRKKWVEGSLRLGLIPAGSTDAVVVSTTGVRDPATSALQIVLGYRLPVDIVRLTSWNNNSNDNNNNNTTCSQQQQQQQQLSPKPNKKQRRTSGLPESPAQESHPPEHTLSPQGPGPGSAEYVHAKGHPTSNERFSTSNGVLSSSTPDITIHGGQSGEEKTQEPRGAADAGSDPVREVRFAASFAGYGFYGDVIKDSEMFRWMGPARYDWSGFWTFLRHQAYEAEVAYWVPDAAVAGAGAGGEGGSSTGGPSSSSSSSSQVVCRTSCGVCKSASDLVRLEEEEEEREKAMAASAAVRGAREREEAGEGGSRALEPSSSGQELVVPGNVWAQRGGGTWKKLSGRFHSICGAVLSCRQSKAPSGVSRYAHLADGNLDLILIRHCSHASYLRQLVSMTQKNVDPFGFEFVEHHKTPMFLFSAMGKKKTHWNVDGELLVADDLLAQVYRGLVHVFARGPET